MASLNKTKLFLKIIFVWVPDETSSPLPRHCYLVPVGEELTHWGQDKMADICSRLFKLIFLHGNCRTSIQISLKFVPNGPIKNKLVLVQIIVWHRPGDKPEPMMAYITYAYMRHSVSMMTSSNGNIFRATGPFVRGTHRWPVDSPHKGQWHGVLIFSLICAWINGCANNRDAGDLRRHRAHCNVTVMAMHRSWPTETLTHTYT